MSVEQKSKRVAVDEQEYSCDGVVPVQGPVVDWFSTVDVKFPMYNFTSSQSASSSSMIVVFFRYILFSCFVHLRILFIRE